MKERILKILREANGVTSGAFLSDRLGITRVAVWKHIRGLREMGYGIESSPKGYLLGEAFDVLAPWEFPGREDRIHYRSEVASTMDVARDLARKGCPAFTVAAAGRQSRGRGRLDRSWASEDGGLYFTVVVRPEIPPLLVSRVNFCASLCLAESLREGFGVPAEVKWPNDILVDERKLVGMLSEMETRADLVSFVNIGIGVNVNNDPRPVEPRAVSMAGLLGRKVSRRDLLAAFLDRFEARLGRDPALDEVIENWKRYAVTLGRRVRVATVREVVEGTAVDVDENGALLLTSPDGTRKKIVHGDCFHQPEPSAKI